jgi:hypothetical protein
MLSGSEDSEFAILLVGVEMFELDDVETLEGFADARGDQSELAKFASSRGIVNPG